MDVMSKNLCITCDLCVPINKVLGECHRYPPGRAGFPIVTLHNFCGEHPAHTAGSNFQGEIATVKEQNKGGGAYVDTGSSFKATFLNKIVGTGVKAFMVSIVLAMFVVFTTPGQAANTVQQGKGTYTIVPDGSTDWAWTEISGASSAGITVLSIQFNPSASSDQLIFRDGLGAAVPVFDSGAVGSTNPVIKYYPSKNGFGKLFQLRMTNADCTFDTPASVLITIEFEL